MLCFVQSLEPNFFKAPAHGLHFLDVNLESTTDTVILHIGINDLLKDILIDNFINFMKNVERMVQKCRGFGGKPVFLSGIMYTKRIAWQILNDVHDRLCKRLNKFM